jgi:hypothetical protein
MLRRPESVISRNRWTQSNESSQCLGDLVASLAFPLKEKEERFGHVQDAVCFLYTFFNASMLGIEAFEFLADSRAALKFSFYLGLVKSSEALTLAFSSRLALCLYASLAHLRFFSRFRLLRSNQISSSISNLL